MKYVIYEKEGDAMNRLETIELIYRGFNNGQNPPENWRQEKNDSQINLDTLINEVYIGKLGDATLPLREQIVKLTDSNNSLSATVNSLTVDKSMLEKEISSFINTIGDNEGVTADLIAQINTLNEEIVLNHQQMAKIKEEDRDAGVKELEAEERYSNLASIIPMVESDKNDPAKALQRLVDGRSLPKRLLTPLEQILEGLRRLWDSWKK